MQTLRLANEDRTVTIPLMGGLIGIRSGFDFATPGQGGVFTYEPYGAQFDFENFQPQTETFSIAITGNGAAVLAEMDRLQDFLESIRLYSDNDIAEQSCWLEWRARGEDEKRSLLYSGTFQVVSKDNVTPGMPTCEVLGTLSLTRHPLWETYESVANTASSKSTLGGIYFIYDTPGNTLARLQRTLFYRAGAATLYRFWLGIRRINQGMSGFESVWECEDSSDIDPDAIGDTAINAPDATASNNSKLTTTFAGDPTLRIRFNLRLDDVYAADYTHAQGRYLVLMRCKVVGAGGVAGIQMRSGYAGNIIHEEVYVDNTSWRLIPLGNISIPPWKGAHYVSDPYYEAYTLTIYAEELNTCDLDMDCFVMIPNEHMVSAEGLAAPSYIGYIRVDEDDTEVGYGYSNAIPGVNDSLDVAMTDWYLPPGDSMMVIAAEDATAHTLGTAAYVAWRYLSRWTLYRGT